MENSKKELEQQWEAELIKRIDWIEKQDGGIRPMTKKDYIVAGVIVVICLCAVVAGAFIS